MRKTIIYILILKSITIANYSFSQDNIRCTELLKKEIVTENYTESYDAFLKDFQTLTYCYFDSLDFQIFSGPTGNFPRNLLTTILLGENKTITFNDILNILKQFKQSNEYIIAKEVVVCLNSIKNKVATIENWNNDVEKLRCIGFIENQVTYIKEIVIREQSNNLTYKDVFAIYNETKSDNLQVEILEAESKNNYLCDSIGTAEWLKGIYGYTDYEKGLECARKMDKPCLIYFNGYGSINSRKIEANILLDEQISDIIKNNYIFIVLVTDAVEKLAAEQQYFSEKLNRRVTKIGERNLDIQMSKFSSDILPLFIVTDKFGKEISRQEYTEKLNIFKDFLTTENK